MNRYFLSSKAAAWDFFNGFSHMNLNEINTKSVIPFARMTNVNTRVIATRLIVFQVGKGNSWLCECNQEYCVTVRLFSATPRGTRRIDRANVWNDMLQGQVTSRCQAPIIRINETRIIEFYDLCLLFSKCQTLANIQKINKTP